MKKTLLSLTLIMLSLLGGYYAYQFFYTSPVATINGATPVENLSAVPGGNTNRSK